MSTLLRGVTLPDGTHTAGANIAILIAREGYAYAAR